MSIQRTTAVLDEAAMIELYEKYLDNIEKDGCKDYPSKSGFAKYLEVSRSEVYAWFSSHAYAEKKIKQFTADTVAGGMMLKKYAVSGAMNVLKNECNWQDNPQQSKAAKRKLASNKEAKELLDSYNKERLETKKSNK